MPALEELERVYAEASIDPTFGKLLQAYLTDYVGRSGLRRFKVRFTSQVWPGDTITCGGKVTKKYEANGEKRIEGDLFARNQKGDSVIQGAFVAAIASR